MGCNLLGKIPVLLLVLLGLGGALIAWDKPPQDDLSLKLGKRLATYNLPPSTFVGALLHVGKEFKIPLGIVWVDTPRGHVDLPLSFKNVSVQELLETIAKAEPGYQMKIKCGVAHIAPSGLIPDRENFLTTKIGAFRVQGEDVEAASFKLHNLITPTKFAGFSVGATGDSKVELDLRNFSVEDALDALAINSNRKIWIVTFSDDANLTPRGFRRTKSLFTDVPVPDKEQPIWHFLRWEDPPPPAVASKPGRG